MSNLYFSFYKIISLTAHEYKTKWGALANMLGAQIIGRFGFGFSVNLMYLVLSWLFLDIWGSSMFPTALLRRRF